MYLTLQKSFEQLRGRFLHPLRKLLPVRIVSLPPASLTLSSVSESLNLA
jgi:hypothetical protein